MDIRDKRTWCDKCTAPLVYAENVAPIGIFLSALPAWRSGGMEHIFEGFERSELIAVMDLEQMPNENRKYAWEAIQDLESEFARIRSIRRAAKNGK